MFLVDAFELLSLQAPKEITRSRQAQRMALSVSASRRTLKRTLALRAPAREAIDALQQVWNAVRSRHLHHMRCRLVHSDTRGSHEERTLTAGSEHVRGMRGPAKRSLCYADDSRRFSERLEEVGTKPGALASIEPDVAVDHHGINPSVDRR